MARGKISIPVLCIVFSLCGVGGGAQDLDIPLAIPNWRHALGGAVIGYPVAQVESVAAATDGGNLKSFSKDGLFLWDYFARGRLTPYVARSREGTSYICRTNGLLIAVNRSGRELWRVNLESPITSPVLTGWDGRLFVFTGGKITCMTAAGYTLWSKPLEAKLRFAPVMDAAGGVILAQENGQVLRLDPFGNVFSHTVMAPGPVAAASLELSEYGPSILLLFADRHLELLYPPPEDGESLSEESLGGESLKGKLDLPAAPLAALGVRDRAAVLLEDGRVLLLSLAEKKILWTGTGHIRAGELAAAMNSAAARISAAGSAGAAAAPGPAGADGAAKLIFDERGVYVLTKTGATGFADDGRRLWIIRITGAASIPAFGDDGVLYSGGADWILYAYRLEDRVRAHQRLLYGEAPEGSYGTGNPGPSSQADYYFRFEEAELERRFGEIRGAVKAGAVGANEKEYAAWLMETARNLPPDGVPVPRNRRPADPRSGNPPRAQPLHRVEAVNLLAFIGSRETIPFLADLFTRDSDALVRAAAALAIGKIGVDPEGLAMRAFENALLPPAPLADETILVAVTGAVGALCRFSGPPLSDTGVKLLTILAGYDRFPLVRGRAQRELGSL